MLPTTKTGRSLALAVLALGFLMPSQGLAQGKVHYHGSVRCNSGHCGSPLAGPCAPQRMTYGYVPTSWRRWPTDQISAEPLPEQVPTPAKEPSSRTKPDELPLPNDSTEETTPRTPSQDQAPTMPPFGSQSPTPPFGDAPQAPPFGDEPQAPPPAADPLAVPPSDEPPAPPADATGSPPAASALPSSGSPTGESGSSPPAFENEGPPTLPTDDPFKDDPEMSGPTPEAGAQLYQSQRAARERLAALQASDSDQNLAAEPRLLRADGGNLEVNPLPEPAAANPLRQVSHPVRRTSSIVEQTPPAAKPARVDQGVWRRNPLRSN